LQKKVDKSFLLVNIALLYGYAVHSGEDVKEQRTQHSVFMNTMLVVVVVSASECGVPDRS